MPTLQRIFDVLRELEKETRSILGREGRILKDVGRERTTSYIPPSSEIFAFVLMPFKKELDELYRDVIKPTVEGSGFSCYRADDLFTTNRIMDDVEEAIDSANFIIADLTGRNTNVFYEVGMSHEKEKKVILLTQDKDDVPFDLQHWRLLIYKDDEKGRKKLAKSLARTIKTIAQT